MATPTAPYPPTLSPQQLSNLISNVKDYQITHGMLLKYGFDAHSINAIPLGVSLFPSLFPGSLFEEARELQAVYNKLYARVVEDEEWLFGVLEDLIEDDEFAKTLWEIYQEVKDEGYVQDVLLGLFRSDYMVNISQDIAASRPTLALKQVEFNTYSVAGGTHSNHAAEMHKHLNQICATCLPQNGGAFASHTLLSKKECLPPPLLATASAVLADPIGMQRPPMTTPYERLPSNDTLASLVSGLAAAHEKYGPPKSGQAFRTGILFIVQPRNMNICDERPLEYALWNHEPQIPAYRVLFGEEALACTTLTQSRELLYQPPSGSPLTEVSVVYLRAGYDPDEYTPSGYGCRLLLERSRAIKCPSILGHLATFKKVQQALTAPGTLTRFLSHTEAERVGKTFAPMYPLDESSEAGKQGRTLACSPQMAVSYVLKPSLEGGGHNVYRGEIPEFLDSVSRSRWHTYILMELINPVIQKNILLSPRGIYTAAEADSLALRPSSEERQGHCITESPDQLPGPTVSELGIFGICLWRSRPQGHYPQLLRNGEAGWSLKTKPKAVDEMSVVKGYGCFDCPYLVDEETYLANSEYVT